MVWNGVKLRPPFFTFTSHFLHTCYEQIELQLASYSVSNFGKFKLIISFDGTIMGHNIMRLFDVLPNFPFTASETMSDYYL